MIRQHPRQPQPDDRYADPFVERIRREAIAGAIEEVRNGMRYAINGAEFWRCVQRDRHRPLPTADDIMQRAREAEVDGTAKGNDVHRVTPFKPGPRSPRVVIVRE